MEVESFDAASVENPFAGMTKQGTPDILERYKTFQMEAAQDLARGESRIDTFKAEIAKQERFGLPDMGLEEVQQIRAAEAKNAALQGPPDALARYDVLKRLAAQDLAAEQAQVDIFRAIRGDAYGRWAADVLATLGLDRPALVGSSGGAWLILKLAEIDPGRIGRAVLLSPAGIAPIRLRFILAYLAIAAVTPAQTFRCVKRGCFRHRRCASIRRIFDGRSR